MKEALLVLGGALVGWVLAVITDYPRFKSWLYALIKVEMSGVEWNTQGNALVNIGGKYTIVNGHTEPLHYREVAIEFSDKKISMPNTTANSLPEQLQKMKGKWILYNQELTVNQLEQQDFGIGNLTLLRQLQDRRKIKMRIAVRTLRYGKVYSKWKKFDFSIVS